MPINEAQGFRSSLTPQQQREAMESVYGLGGNVSPTVNQELSYEERVRMRQILDDLDRKETAGRKEFDLAKPPVPPYQYKAFPFLMYNHRTRQTQAARSELEKDGLIAQGWSVEPFPAEAPPQPQLTPQERVETERLDMLLKMAPEEFDALVAASKEPPQPERKRRA